MANRLQNGLASLRQPAQTTVPVQTVDLGPRQPLDIGFRDIEAVGGQFYNLWSLLGLELFTNGTSSHALSKKSLDMLIVLPESSYIPGRREFEMDETTEALNALFIGEKEPGYITVLHYDPAKVAHLQSKQGFTLAMSPAHVPIANTRADERLLTNYFYDFLARFRNIERGAVGNGPYFYNIPGSVVQKIEPVVLGNWPSSRGNLQEHVGIYDIVVFPRDSTYLDMPQEKEALADLVRSWTAAGGLYIGSDMLKGQLGFRTVFDRIGLGRKAIYSVNSQE